MESFKYLCILLLIIWCVIIQGISAKPLKAESVKEAAVDVATHNSKENGLELGELGELGELSIESSIATGRPIIGGKLGPLNIQDHLKLICSHTGPKPHRMQWYSGYDHDLRPLKSSKVWMTTVQDPNGNTVIESKYELDVGVLRLSDSERRFTCKTIPDESRPTVLSQSVQLIVVELDVTKDGELLKTGEITVKEGDSLSMSCLNYGYEPFPLEWKVAGNTNSHNVRQTEVSSQYVYKRVIELNNVQDTAGSELVLTCFVPDSTVSQTVHVKVVAKEPDSKTRLTELEEKSLQQVSEMVSRVPTPVLLLGLLGVTFIVLGSIMLGILIFRSKKQQVDEEDSKPLTV